MKKIIALMLLLVSPASGQPISLDDLSSYFNVMTTAESFFIQIADDGSQ